jgi:hypothetical protein
MSAVMTEPGVPAVSGQRRCGIDEVFAGPFIELIGLAPRNPVVRGLILAQIRKMPGPECETFEQIKEWVETTCDKKLRPPNQPTVRAAEGIIISVEFSETEYGRANYSVPRSGSDSFVLEADELIEMVRAAIESGDGLQGVIESIASLIDDEAWDRCEPSLEDSGDYDYGDHDSDDSGNSTTEYSKTQIHDRLLAFLRERHPDLLEELV